ncbi:MAG: acyl-CoA desaturase [Myxococcales bacterium]|jgi:stearoyl-CoA desaturase (delta-9 desaturase)
MSQAIERPADERVAWVPSIPFILLHLAPLGLLWTGFTAFDVALCIGFYAMRMFFITASYHRYFSHRSYKMGRVMQFLMALGGTLAVQKGPLWWAGHHRHHHKHSDQAEDIHSPLKGFWWSHVGWIVCAKFNETPTHLIRDFAKFPELRWLDRFHWVPPLVLGVAVWAAFGWSALFMGYFLSLVLAWHCTYFINSLTHLFGRRRYVTTDTSRNSFILALVTFGEGWHNNHHYYQSSANQGFFWWEIDISYYVLKLLSWVGLVKDLRNPPQHVVEANRLRDGYADIGMFQANWKKAVRYLDSARAQAGEYYEERKHALDEMVESTSEAAQRIADIPVKAPAE